MSGVRTGADGRGDAGPVIAGLRVRPATCSAPRGGRGDRDDDVERRRPEATVLHAVVRDHLESFLEDARQRSAHGFGVPRHVERELRNYLACGVLAVVWEELASRLDRGGSNAFDPSITVDAAGGRSWSGTTIRRAWPTWRPGWTNP